MGCAGCGTEREMMKERPILFSAPMVRAILDGRKTMTRRVVKSFKHLVPAEGRELDCIKDKDGLPSRLDMAPDNWDCCPYGQPGDRLWVREAWRQAYAATSYSPGIVYRADASKALGMDEYSDRHKWKPGIHMFRKDCRINLEITGVRVERLQDISYEDALAEGVADFRGLIEDECQQPGETPDQCARRLRWPQRDFETLWESINGPGSWALNPWVWVVLFRKI